MARRSLRPHLNQIRTWVRQGRTDAWIAHQLEVSVKDIDSFKREHGLAPESGDNGESARYDDVDLRAEDDALVAAELEAEQARKAEEAAAAAAKAAEEAAAKAAAGEDADDEEAEKPTRRRGRRGRGGKGRSASKGPLEGTFDHGEEGYGLWLDPAVEDDPIYAEHWAGHRPVEVTIEADRIVIRRAESGDGDDDT
jgi:hypothetical protein